MPCPSVRLSQASAHGPGPQRRSVEDVLFHAHTTEVSVVGPRVWNALPSYLRQSMSYRHFKRSLKVSRTHVSAVGIVDRGAFLHLKNSLSHLLIRPHDYV